MRVRIRNIYLWHCRGSLIDIEAGMAADIIDFQIIRPEIRTSPDYLYLVQAYIICSPGEARNKKR